jgi:hypothetical protein
MEAPMVLLASDFDKSNYLRAEDIAQDKKFRIKAVTEQTFERDSGGGRKLILWFTNDEHGLVLNKTNVRTLRGAFGDDTAGWVGKVIAIYPTQTDFKGKMVPALRVRVPPPKAAALTTVPTGNGTAATAPAGNGGVAAADDPELTSDPVKPPTQKTDDEEKPF